MKQILLLISICLSMAVFSQGLTPMTNPNGSAIDSLSNTTAEGPSVKVPEATKGAAFVLELTTLTGTVAGKVYLQGANSSGKWAFPYLDSVTLAPGTNNWQLSATDVKFGFYRLWVVPTGTQSTSYKGTAYFRRR